MSFQPTQNESGEIWIDGHDVTMTGTFPLSVMEHIGSIMKELNDVDVPTIYYGIHRERGVMCGTTNRELINEWDGQGDR